MSGILAVAVKFIHHHSLSEETPGVRFEQPLESLVTCPRQGDTLSGGRHLVSNWRPVDWRKHSCPSLSEELDQFVNEWQ